MKRLFLPILTALLLATTPLMAQSIDVGDVINLSGDSGTEQAAKLELIRILQERLDKMTVANMNSRIIVSQGVASYYKVDEIKTMFQNMYSTRTKYVVQASNLEATAGSGFSGRYITQYNAALGQAKVIKTQLETVVKSGSPIKMPAMPSFSISPAGADPGADYVAAMNQIMAQYGVHSQDDVAALSPEQRTQFDAAIKAANEEMGKAIQKAVGASNSGVLKTVGNVVGSAFGLPGAGSVIAGLLGGGGGVGKAISGLVGSIVDNFQIPSDYYDSNTLKLTDAERLRMIDELHVRMSELYQQTVALGANMSSETRSRNSEASIPRNEVILYGPKK